MTRTCGDVHRQQNHHHYHQQHHPHHYRRDHDQNWHHQHDCSAHFYHNAAELLYISLQENSNLKNSWKAWRAVAGGSVQHLSLIHISAQRARCNSEGSHEELLLIHLSETRRCNSIRRCKALSINNVPIDWTRTQWLHDYKMQKTAQDTNPKLLFGFPTNEHMVLVWHATKNSISGTVHDDTNDHSAFGSLENIEADQ